MTSLGLKTVMAVFCRARLRDKLTYIFREHAHKVITTATTTITTATKKGITKATTKIITKATTKMITKARTITKWHTNKDIIANFEKKCSKKRDIK